MESHIPYEHIVKRACDFIIKYKFYSEQEGGRKTGTPSQGYRSDFMYSEDEENNSLWIIWPEFLDVNGNVIIDKTINVDANGKAQMWIINKDLIEKHNSRIRIGQKGYLMEGNKKVAECEVLEIINLI